MTLYEFTVHLDRAPDEAGLDAIFEAGLDDTAPEISADGRAVLHVMRETTTLTEAIVTVVDDITRAGFQAVGIDSEDLVVLSEIGKRTGRTRESVRLLATGRRGPGGFPAPVADGKRPLYSWAAVREWFRDHYGDDVAGEADRDADTLAAADLLLRARLLAPDPGSLAPLVTT